VTATSTANTLTSDRAELAGGIVRLYKYAGTSRHYPWRFIAGQNNTDIALQAGAVETLGSETYDVTFMRCNRTLGGGVAELAFFGATPAARPAAISSPSADVASLKTAVDALRSALTTLGLTA
jgi:hypothetical protein